MAIHGILFPLEIAEVDPNCIICYGKLQWTIFCPQCKQGNCHICLQQWFQQKLECPKCRFGFQMPADKGRYGCISDGNLVEFYCEQCNVCICRECRENSANKHHRHKLRSLDSLRMEMIHAVQVLSETNNLARSEANRKVLNKIKSLIRVGSPWEWVQQRRAVHAEIATLKPMISANDQSTTVLYNLPNTDFSETSFFLTKTNAESQLFSVEDKHGNAWELTVYPGGYSDAKGKFISVYLKLTAGSPKRYEYRFRIFDSNNRPLESYCAVDDFTVGSQSIACQRLISINQARLKADGKNSYKMAFATRPTDQMYGHRCATALAENRAKRLSFKTFTYLVEKFSEHKSANRILFSKVLLDQQNIAWRLRIDCNGHWEQDQYVSVFLELLNGAEGWFDIFIKVLNPNNPTISFKRELTHKFTVHSNWGVPHFIPQLAVYQYLSADQLMFEFGMRPAYVEKESQ